MSRKFKAMQMYRKKKHIASKSPEKPRISPEEQIKRKRDKEKIN